jgi:RNA polymerase sigma-70 factor (ECF subfamily)
MAAASSGYDCGEALLACARLDRDALRRIYEAEGPYLVGVALRILRRRDLAEEAVHDAFVEIWQKAAVFDPARGAALAWITGIVRYRALSILRKRSRETPVEPGDLDDLPDLAADPAEALARLSAADALRQCLEVLDADKRLCILLAFVDGYSHSQIAARLDTPLGTVKAWIRRGLLALRECLG